ncbi:MAG: glycosyltransferase family 4 protein [Bacteroidia bacterium]|nr:glycosyltransferase family 4 protein [Bacteroidia bacterium]
MPKHVVMIIANSPNPSYFSWFAEINAKEKAFKFTFVFLCLEKPQVTIDKIANYGAESKWYYFNYATKKHIQYIKLFFKLFFLFRKIKPDVVQTNLFDDSLPGLLAAKLAGVKKRVITKQDTGFHLRYAPKGIRYDIFNNTNATDIIPVSQESFELIMKHEKPDATKVKIIHHGVNQNFMDSATQAEIESIKSEFNLHNKTVIGTVARYVELKGYKEVIEAAAILNKTKNNLVFIGVGWGPKKEELDNLIKQLHLEDKFLLPGRIEFDKIPAFYKCLDIYVHASHYEPFGFVIAEAMFSKVPIVSTNVGASRDVLLHKDSAYIAKMQDPDDLAAGINYILNANKKEIAEKAYKIGIERFSKEVMWNNYKNLFLA